MTFRESDKVVCVDDSPGKGNNILRGTTLPITKGKVYTVRGVSECGGLYLSGIVLPIITNTFYGDVEGSFLESRFRLLSEVQAENAAKREVGV